MDKKEFEKNLKIICEEKRRLFDIQKELFLGNYAIKLGEFYLPKDERLREYYNMYEKYGNEVDTTINKEKFI